MDYVSGVNRTIAVVVSKPIEWR